MGKIKLKVNVPVVGQVKEARFWTGKDWTDPETNETKRLPDNIGLRGTWTQLLPGGGHEAVDGMIYLNLDVRENLVALGMLADEEPQEFKYRVLDQGPWRITKTEDGKRRPIVVERANGKPAPKPNGQPQEHAPTEENPWLPWQLLEKEYGLCLKMAHRQWRSLIDGIEDQEAGLAMTPDPQTLQAAAATILIQAERRGLRIPQ